MYRPQCYLTADSLLIVNNSEVLLIRRKHDPFQGRWALPGGFVELDEKILTAAERELWEETGIRDVPLEEFGTYGDPGRDPRGRVVCVVFWSLLTEKPQAIAGDDAAECGWFHLNDLPDLAFDHGRILQDAGTRLQEKR